MDAFDQFRIVRKQPALYSLPEDQTMQGSHFHAATYAGAGAVSWKTAIVGRLEANVNDSLSPYLTVVSREFRVSPIHFAQLDRELFRFHTPERHRRRGTERKGKGPLAIPLIDRGS